MEARLAKGVFGGPCNRTVCQRFGADWYNHSTRAYYCRGCALIINQQNAADAQRLYGHELCTPGEHKPAAAPLIELRADRVGFDSPAYKARIDKVRADVESLKSHNPNRRD